MGARVVRGVGGRPQVQASGKTTWSAAKESRFLEHLAVSCNVRASCGKSGLSESAVYRRRATHAAFRASWARAIGEAVQRLELMLLQRAMKGKVVKKTRGAETTRTVEYPDQIAMALIRAHKDTAEPEEPDDEETLAAPRAKILRKLDVVAKREAAQAGVAGVGQAPGQAPREQAPGEQAPAGDERSAGNRTRDARGRFVAASQTASGEGAEGTK